MRTHAAVALFVALSTAACASGDKPSRPEGVEAAQGSEDAEKKPKNRVSRDSGNAGVCPSMGVLYDASRIVKFASEDQRFANVAWTGEFWGVRGLCRYINDEPITLNLEVSMGFGRGPAADASRHTFRYWVAVTRRDRLPLAKQYFEAPVEFERGAERAETTQVIEGIKIPRANDKVSGGNFEVLVGFDLDEQQLAFNRAGKRFRVDVGG
jgi:hypothetical protein